MCKFGNVDIHREEMEMIVVAEQSITACKHIDVK